MPTTPGLPSFGCLLLDPPGLSVEPRVLLIREVVVHALVHAGDALAEDRHTPVSYTHLRAHETVLDLVCRLLLAKKKH